MKSKNIRTKFLCISLPTILICLLLAEIFIRFFNLCPEIYEVQKGRFRLSDNPLIGFEPVPHFETEIQTEDPMVLFRSRANSLGFRDREHAVEKKKGIYRIIVLGDSIVHGLGVQDDESVFTSVLESDLKEKGRPVEVLNFGVSGYNTQQEVETLKAKGLPYRPDLVVLTYCLNDTFPPRGPILRTLLDERSKLLEGGGGAISSAGELMEQVSDTQRAVQIDLLFSSAGNG